MPLFDTDIFSRAADSTHCERCASAAVRSAGFGSDTRENLKKENEISLPDFGTSQRTTEHFGCLPGLLLPSLPEQPYRERREPYFAGE